MVSTSQKSFQQGRVSITKKSSWAKSSEIGVAGGVWVGGGHADCQEV